MSAEHQTRYGSVWMSPQPTAPQVSQGRCSRSTTPAPKQLRHWDSMLIRSHRTLSVLWPGGSDTITARYGTVSFGSAESRSVNTACHRNSPACEVATTSGASVDRSFTAKGGMLRLPESSPSSSSNFPRGNGAPIALNAFERTRSSPSRNDFKTLRAPLASSASHEEGCATSGLAADTQAPRSDTRLAQPGTPPLRARPPEQGTPIDAAAIGSPANCAEPWDIWPPGSESGQDGSSRARLDAVIRRATSPPAAPRLPGCLAASRQARSTGRLSGNR